MTERLAVFVHGMAASLNLLGVAYNFLISYEKMGVAAVFDRDVLIHAASFEYHRRSALKHAKRLTHGLTQNSQPNGQTNDLHAEQWPNFV